MTSIPEKPLLPPPPPAEPFSDEPDPLPPQSDPEGEEPVLNRTLVIGCTMTCSDRFSIHIGPIAAKHGYDIRFVTLMDDPNVSVDAIISPGGGDPDPKYYAWDVPEELRLHIEAHHKRKGIPGKDEPERAEFEYDFFKGYLSGESHEGVPVLGVCYGMQIIAGVLGIPLHVDMEEDIGIQAQQRVTNTINIDEGTPAAQIFQAGALEFSAYENHHQAINLTYFLEHRGKFPNVSLGGFSHDGKIPEVMVLTDKPVLGVQFHPDYHDPSQSDNAALMPFVWLVEKAIERKETHEK